MLRRSLLSTVFVVALTYLASPWMARGFDAFLNRVEPTPTQPDDGTGSLHARLRIVDLHSDATLWDRDLLTRGTRGHVDIPRLLDGNVALECFSAATRHPIASNYRRTPNVLDVAGLLAIAQRWPARTWFDSFERARYHARRLDDTARRSQGAFEIVLSRADLGRLDQLRRTRKVVGGILLLEGLHPIGRDITRVDSLFTDGFRVFGIAHMFDNGVGGSAHGWRRGGLTGFGRRVVARIDSLGGIVDLAHASPQTIRDVLALSTRPLLVSHTGIQSACPGPRNLSDADAAAIAKRGGLIGVGFWDAAVCGQTAVAVAKSLRRAIEVAGIDRVAIGSDFDGAVATPFDAARLVELTQALVAEGFTEREIQKIMGENAWKFFADALPQ